VISNCAINLSVDKSSVLTEIARMLKPGGRRRVHPPGRGRHAWRDRQSGEDERASGEGAAGDPGGGKRRLLLKATLGEQCAQGR
jgi:hypothetical protein